MAKLIADGIKNRVWHKTWRPEGICSELFTYLQEKLNSHAKRVTLIVNPRFSEPASLLIRKHTNKKIKKTFDQETAFPTIRLISMEDLAVLAEVVVSHQKNSSKKKKGPYNEHQTT